MTDNLDMAITDIDELERDAKINGGVTIGVGTVEYLVGRIRAAETRVKSAEAALQPFRSGGDWGSVKAWIVGKGFQDHGTRVAKQITEWQTVVDAVLAEG